jgi:signal recognition particle GTPase
MIDTLAEELEVTGFKEHKFDRGMLDTLVMNPRTKSMIRDLTDRYMKNFQDTDEDPTQLEKHGASKIALENQQSPWSADFVKGKGEGLIFLLHGKPGVGKTYTAGRISPQN